MFHTAAALASAFEARHTQSGLVALTASADTRQDPDFGGEKTVDSIQAAGVLSFNGAGKTRNGKAQSHFFVLGQPVKEGEVVELPEADFKRMEANGQVVEATEEDIAATQKATKTK